jgi:hypothetical protein
MRFEPPPIKRGFLFSRKGIYHMDCGGTSIYFTVQEHDPLPEKRSPICEKKFLENFYETSIFMFI